MLTKRCGMCLTEKPLTEYNKYKAGRLGVQNRCRSCQSKYSKDNKQKIAAVAKEYVKRNRERIAATVNAYYQKNKARLADYHVQYYKNNKDKYRSRQAPYQRKRRASDPLFKLVWTLRKSCGRIAKGGMTTSAILGCTWDEAKKHMERQFDSKMSWENHGAYWQIDHVIPLSYAENDDEARKLCHYTNLRPLSAVANKQKLDRLEAMTSEGVFYV